MGILESDLSENSKGSKNIRGYVHGRNDSGMAEYNCME